MPATPPARFLALLGLALLALAPTHPHWVGAQTLPNPCSLELQGHRGARGLFPENTLPGLVHTYHMGVDVLEFDLAISQEGIPILSHEPWFNPQICTAPAGMALPPPQVPLYSMSLEAIQRIDCGSQGHPNSPHQQPIPAPKPTLAAVLDTLEALAKRDGRTLGYNIELKTRPDWDGRYYPGLSGFIQAVLDVMDNSTVGQRWTLQCFDPRVLNRVARQRPDVRLVFLMEDGPSQHLARTLLQATPEAVSPEYTWLTPKRIDSLHALGQRVIPWTVNDPLAMQRLAQWGVDGLITDYPDRWLRHCGKAAPLPEGHAAGH